MKKQPMETRIILDFALVKKITVKTAFDCVQDQKITTKAKIQAQNAMHYMSLLPDDETGLNDKIMILSILLALFKDDHKSLDNSFPELLAEKLFAEEKCFNQSA